MSTCTRRNSPFVVLLFFLLGQERKFAFIFCRFITDIHKMKNLFSDDLAIVWRLVLIIFLPILLSPTDLWKKKMSNCVYRFIGIERDQNLRPSIKQSSANIHCQQSCLLSLAIILILLSLALISLGILIYTIPCPQTVDNGTNSTNQTQADNQSKMVPLNFPNLFYAWKCPYFTLYFVNKSPNQTNAH